MVDFSFWWSLTYVFALLGPCVTDLTRRTIPNKLILVLLVYGVALGMRRQGLVGVGGVALGLFISGGIFFVLYTFGGIGGGDVKLAGAFGGIVGGDLALKLVLFAWLYLGTWAVVDLLRRRQLPLWLAPGLLLRSARAERRTLPMAPALALGALSAEAFLWLPY